MGATDDPTKLFEHLNSLQNRFKRIKIEDEDLIAVIFSVAPKECKPVLVAEQRAKGANLTTNDLQDAVQQHC